MPSKEKRAADDFSRSTVVPPSAQPPIATTSTGASPTPERRSKRRKIVNDAVSSAVVSNSDAGSSTSRTQQLLSKKRTRKAKLAAETKANTLHAANSPKQPVERADISQTNTQETSGPPTPTSVINELLDTSGTEAASLAEDPEILDRITLLEQQLREKDQQIETQRNLLGSLLQHVQCQICLDSFVEPYALVPCGHIACLACLQQWFQSSSTGVHAGLFGPVPVIRRKKTCPHCRTEVVQRPVMVRLIKSITNDVIAGLSPESSRTSSVPEVSNVPANEDPWKNIFPIERHGANRGMDGAIIDHEDGGIRRCPNCLTEIFHGVCVGCGDEFYDDHLSEYEDSPPRELYFGAPPFAWDPAGMQVHDDEEEDDHPTESDNEFINDREIDYDEDSPEYLSEEEEDRPLALPLFRGSPPRRQRNDASEVIEPTEDSDEGEEVLHHVRMHMRIRAPQRHIILSDDEESETDLLSEDDDHYQPHQVLYNQLANQHLSPVHWNNFQGQVQTVDINDGSDEEVNYAGNSYHHMIDDLGNEEERHVQDRYYSHRDPHTMYQASDDGHSAEYPGGSNDEDEMEPYMGEIEEHAFANWEVRDESYFPGE